MRQSAYFQTHQEADSLVHTLRRDGYAHCVAATGKMPVVPVEYDAVF